MQYPIIDNLIYSYLVNGWTGLDIPETIELNYYQEGSGTPSPDNIRNIVPGGVFDVNGNNVIVGNGILDVVNKTLTVTSLIRTGLTATTIGETSTGFKYTDCAYITNPPALSANTQIITNMYNFILSHLSGYSGVIKTYISAYTVYDNRFTTIQIANELLNEIQIVYPYSESYILTVSEVAKYINGAFSNDIAHRLKLPLPHYFPHPVIDALQRAAAGTQTADDTEILQHYLTPLGIGGI